MANDMRDCHTSILCQKYMCVCVNFVESTHVLGMLNMMPVELDVKGLYKQNAPLLVTDYVIGEHTQVHANTIILKCEPTVWSLYGKEDKTATLDIQKTKTPTPPHPLWFAQCHVLRSVRVRASVYGENAKSPSTTTTFKYSPVAGPFVMFWSICGVCIVNNLLTSETLNEIAYCRLKPNTFTVTRNFVYNNDLTENTITQGDREESECVTFLLLLHPNN